MDEVKGIYMSRYDPTVTILEFARKLNLPDHVIATAIEIYKRASENGATLGGTRECISAASLYISSRIHRLPLYLNEFTVFCNRKELATAYRAIVTKTSIKVPPPSVDLYVDKISKKLNLDPDVAVLAKEILKKLSRGIVEGRNPTVMAAAAIYTACLMLRKGEKLTQREIAKVAGVTEVSIRTRYKEITKRLKINVWKFPIDTIDHRA